MGVLTSGRQDWGILRSTCTWLRSSPAFELQLMVGGMACAEEFGAVEHLVLEEGFVPVARLPWLDTLPAGAGPHHEVGSVAAMVGDALARARPAALLLVGDRYETLAAAMAATLQRVPLVHLHGGEDTEGAFDNALRNAITKLAHLHLVSHEIYARRVIAMGEDPGTVHVVGAPGLDNARRSDLASRAELSELLACPLEPPIVVVTVHPTTLADDPAADARAVCEAMERVDATYVVTLPNSDPGRDAVHALMSSAARGARRCAVIALGSRRYWGLMRAADAMLGNSSSGLIEAPALHLPSVNVGDRQKGRIRGPSVIDVAADGAAVAAGLRLALSRDFRTRVSRAEAPFGDGHAAQRIGAVLSSWTPPSPPVKRSVAVLP